MLDILGREKEEEMCLSIPESSTRLACFSKALTLYITPNPFYGLTVPVRAREPTRHKGPVDGRPSG